MDRRRTEHSTWAARLMEAIGFDVATAAIVSLQWASCSAPRSTLS
jgi:hypothetical protein